MAGGKILRKGYDGIDTNRVHNMTPIVNWEKMKNTDSDRSTTAITTGINSWTKALSHKTRNQPIQTRTLDAFDRDWWPFISSVFFTEKLREDLSLCWRYPKVNVT